ncbi:MAG: GntR family transcriptional regulator [Candidatus Omnitrophica bacterium]|jgi:DNA-binding LacI/PurR family transcriptional regulator|nr:GntR family transcriptional regulator [Candidatus Omnitrophota bacterium]
MNTIEINKIDRKNPVPMYVQIKQIIKSQIAEGILKPGSLLDSERKLCKIYNVSHITVRQALVELTKEKLLFRVPGKGTFVSNHRETALLTKNIIGLIIPDHSMNLPSSFIPDLILGIKDVISKRYSLVLYNDSEIDYLTSEEINGIILTNPQSNDIKIILLKKREIPLVVIGRTEEKNIYYVDNDNILIGWTLTSYLLKLGHKRIGFINGPENLTVSQDRLIGYKKALKEKKISIDNSIIRYGNFSEEDGYNNARHIINEKITGIICGDDLIAMGVLKAVKQAGLKIPEDVSICGCNNSIFTQHSHPTLTTINVFPREIGHISAENLIKIMKGESTEEKTLIEGKLIIRNSTGPVKKILERG